MKKISFALIMCAIISSCGAQKQTSSGYKGYQDKPSNETQAAAANRGVKLEAEECEALASDITAENLREFGNGVSSKESFATNKALLDARTKMAQRIKTYVAGLIVNADSETQTEGTYTSLSGEAQTAKWNEVVSNAKVLKKNTYVKENGQYNVYVCIEMPKEQLQKVYEDLSSQKQISAKVTEKMFIEGLKMLQIEK